LSKKSLEKIPQSTILKYSLKAGDPIFVLPKGYFKNLSQTENSFLKPVYEPVELSKYHLGSSFSKEMIYLTKATEVKGITNLINHLIKYKSVLDLRRETQQGKLKFYHLHWPRTESFFAKGEKILSVRKCSEPTFTFTEKPAYVMMSFNVIKSNRVNLKYLCGLLNSTLIKFWLLKKGKMQGSQFQVDEEPLLEIPIYVPADKKEIDKVTQEVDKVIALKETLSKAKTESDKTFYQNQILSIESSIDELFFDLYGIKDNEQTTINAILKKI